MGDDIKAARAFIDLCSAHMETVISADCKNAEAIALLEAIDQGAQSMHARAISRVARQVNEELTYQSVPLRSHGGLLALNKLIKQYESGLVEVESAIEPAKTEPVAVKAVTPRQQDPDATFRVAAETLRSTLSLARPGPERTTLESLIKFDPSVTARTNEKLSLDTVMPGVTDKILREARQQGKSVSLSMAGEGIDLSPRMLRRLEKALTKIGCDLVRQSIEAPDRRRQKGRSQSAHMAMTAQIDGNRLHILIHVDGLAPSRSILNAAELADLQRLGMKSGLRYEDGKACVALADIPVDDKAKQRVIAKPKTVPMEISA